MNKIQMAVLFWYPKSGETIERFLGFFQPTRLTAPSLTSILLEELKGLVGHDPDKLIALTYDGAASLSGIRNGV